MNYIAKSDSVLVTFGEENKEGGVGGKIKELTRKANNKTTHVQV